MVVLFETKTNLREKSLVMTSRENVNLIDFHDKMFVTLILDIINTHTLSQLKLYNHHVLQ